MEAVSSRDAMPIKGAKFWRDGDDVMFQFVIDAGNVIGPRLAMKADSENHPEAWQLFILGEEPPTPDPAGATEPIPEPLPAISAVGENDLSGYAAVIEPRPKRAYTKRKAA